MTTSLPSSLEYARIQGLPGTAYYIPDFISASEEQAILDKIAATPRPKWKQLTHRRLQTWPSDLVRDKLLQASLPPWLEDPIVARILALRLSDETNQHIFSSSAHQRPNHVLINEYPPGDGAAYWPVVCTISLGGSLCLNLHRNNDDGILDPNPAWRILQEPRSLLIIAESLYTDYLHGIADITQDVDLSAQGNVANWPLLGDADMFAGGRSVRRTRTSLTYRDVLNVSTVGNKLGIFPRR
ncbi:hypothetical protein HIM_06554 [Hirsutella minnesotensis 3608]|uniref:Fe2OG dioxygenase domain-containing protein n=1 Tax=Hirsutella minnesotensis 3608 TaxID=1043627 RepID=A0A0F7ZNP4_9HYPO|nr:hypothetical protein HIM_06554 [Hirsutella minnesotensis 3608]